MRFGKERFKALLKELGCDNWFSEIFLYAENPTNLSKEERQSLERHLRSCHRCQAELDFAQKHLTETAGEEVPQWVNELSQSFSQPFEKTPNSLLHILQAGTAEHPLSKFIKQDSVVRVFRKALTEPLTSEEERMDRLAVAACFGLLLTESQRIEVLQMVWKWLNSLHNPPSRSYRGVRAVHQWAAGLLGDAEMVNQIGRAVQKRLTKAAAAAPPSVPETASALWTAVQWLQTAPIQPSVSTARASWLSRAWRPLFAGQAVTASDISEQSHRFKTPEGVIEMSCRWHGPRGERQAHIRITWRANVRTNQELYVRFCHAESQETLSEIHLGANLEGETTLNEKKLGFDPSSIPWNMSLLLK